MFTVGPAQWANAGGDPFIGNVTMLLHLTGANGSTAIPDSSVNNRPFTLSNGTPVISNAQQLFGQNSLYLGTVGDRYTSPNFAGVQFGTGDLTVEFWFYPLSNISSTDFLVFGCHGGAGSRRWAIDVGAGAYASFLIDSSGLSSTDVASLVAGAWNHVAFVRVAGTFKSFVNGVLQFDQDADSTNLDNSLPDFRINDQTTFSGFCQCYLREFRITKGVARYTANFTPPTGPFPNP